MHLPLLFIFGLMVGSFLNVCIDRLPRGRSILDPPSCCEACGHRLGALDLVPVLSYLWLRGRCRYCHSRIPRRLPLVELLTGLLFLGLGYMLGWDLSLVPALAFSSLLMILSVIDLEERLIPNRILYPALPLTLLLSPLWPIPESARSLLRVVPFFPTEVLPLALGHSLLGGVAGFLVLLLPWLLYPGGMGGGDVKLAGLVGLMAGFPLVLLALGLSFVMGGTVSGSLLLLRIRGRKDPIPFGPFLAVGGLAVFLWGEPLVRWYLRL